jgi:fermentation-respiration switch protein FrsA (DUF1100 family)
MTTHTLRLSTPFQRLRRTGRTAITGAAGLVALAMSLMTAGPELAMNGPTVTNIAGVFVGAGGLVLLVLAYRSATAGRRRWVHLLGVLIVLAAVQLAIVPAFNVGVITHAPKSHVRAAASLGYPGARDVTFRASDGVQLRGWYVPGANGAAIIIMHGSHGTRQSELPYVRMLADAGYGVLAVDARGHGESGGETNALGWYGDRDVAGAVNFLRRQSHVHPNDISGLGLSMGAEALLRALSSGVPLAAIVADGAGASTSSDAALEPRGADAPLFNTVSWLTYRGVEAFSGEEEPAGLNSLLHATATPVLLIASNAPHELLLNRRFRSALGAGAALWHVADAGHTKSYAERPEAYRSRVLGFFEQVLRD